MTLPRLGKYLLAIGAVLLAETGVVAQAPQRQTAELIPGVVFVGDGSVTRTETAQGLPIVSFWRPVLFGTEKQPVAGRMDCKITAAIGPYSTAGFDLDTIVKEEQRSRRKAGERDTDRNRQWGDDVRRIDLIGHTRDRAQDYVLTYLAVRTNAEIVDIRRQCRFVHDKLSGKPDFLSYVHRYTALAINLPPAIPLDQMADPTDSEGA